MRNKYRCHIIIATSLVSLLIFSSSTPYRFIDDIQIRYDNYKQKFPTPQIYLFFNQPSYAPGDTAFFKAWYLDENNKPIKNTHILNLDIIDASGRTNQRIHFKLTDGVGKNQIVINNDLKAGVYTFVAYSNWLRNFGTNWFFQKRIQILMDKELKPENSGIQFHVEGGHLVSGVINNLIAIGEPSSSFMIGDVQRSDVMTVKIDSTGMGSFAFVPEKGKNYIANWRNKNIELPSVVDDGIAITLQTGATCDIKLVVSSQSSFKESELYAIVSAQGKLIYKKRISFTENEFKIQIPEHQYGNSIHYLDIISTIGEVVARRTFLPFRNTEIQAEILGTDHTEQRGVISYVVAVRDGDGRLIDSDFATTTFQENLFPVNYSAELISLSGFPDLVEWAEQSGSKSLASINQYLISQLGRNLDWPSIINETQVVTEYPFYSTITMRGNVIDKTTSSPAPDSIRIVSYLQKNVMGYEAFTKDGAFEMPFFFDFWNNDNVFLALQAKSENADNKYEIVIEKDSIRLDNLPNVKEISTPSAYGIYAINKNLVQSSYSFFTRSEATKSILDDNPNAIFEDELSGADFVVNVTKYVVFPTMEDLIREVVSYVHYRKKGASKGVRVLLHFETNNVMGAGDPLYIIDGVMSKDSEFFMSLHPEDLLTIKIVNNPNKLPQIGRIGENGVIMVESKKGNLADALREKTHAEVVGLNRPVQPRSLQSRDAIPERHPDLRSTLYWNANNNTTATQRGEDTFYASDDIGPMKLMVFGLTSDGQFFAAEKTIMVDFRSSSK